MFYVELKTAEENSTPKCASANNERCGPSGDNSTPPDLQLVIKQLERTFESPKTKLMDSQSAHRSVEADVEGICDLPPPPPIKPKQILQTCPMAQEHDTKNWTSDENIEDNVQEMSLKKRLNVLSELVATEETYVKSLSLIVDGYMREMKNPESGIPLPDDLKGGKYRMIFGNIEAIYEWHRDIFLKLLRQQDLGRIIRGCNANLRSMYVTYCQKKPISEHIVAEHFKYFEDLRLSLKHKSLRRDQTADLILDISSLLIKPVQRIMQYELLLRNYLKYTERAGLLHEARDIEAAINDIKKVPKEANDMMVVGRLQNFDGNITAQGRLLHHGRLLCTEIDSNKDSNDRAMYKLKEVQVFLFDKVLILSKIVGKKTQYTDPVYIYNTHIQVNRMKVKELMYNRILLSSTDPKRRELSFVLIGETQEEYREWLDKLIGIYTKQNDFLERLVNPVAYKSESTEL